MASALSSTCTLCGSSVDTTLLAGACPRCMLGEIMQGLPEPGVAHFDGHELLGEIARGGMGVVHRARQHDPERIVALKTLRSASLDSPEAMARFKHEAEVMVALDHPAILPVYRCGDMDGIPYFTMKLVEGGTLGERIDRYAGQWREIVELMAQVGDGVRHAHERGVLHRDLKPGNILFDSAGRSYVSDFGIAKLADSQTACLTMTMSMMGTPHYISPEVAAGGAQAASVSSDVWSLGVMLYELLTGQKPFKGATLTEVLRALEMEEPIAPRRLRGDVPRDLEVITLKALSRAPTHRYSSVQALVEDLRAWLEGRPITARAVPPHERAWMWARRNPKLAGTAALLVLAVFAAVASLVWGYMRVKQENQRVVASQANERARLRESLLSQAHAGREAREMGWRAKGLLALSEAYAIRPGDDVRDEAIAHLAGYDLELGGRCFKGSIFPSPSMEFYALVEPNRRISVRRMNDDAELFRTAPFPPGRLEYRVEFDPRDGWLAISVTEEARVYSMKDYRELVRWPVATIYPVSADGEYLPVREKDRWVLRRTADWSVAGEVPRTSRTDAITRLRTRPVAGSQPLFIHYGRNALDVSDWRTGAKVRQIDFPGLPSYFDWVGDSIVGGCRNDIGQAYDLRRERTALLPQLSFGATFYGNSHSVFMLSSGGRVTQFWHLPTGTLLVRGRGLSVQEFGTDDRRFVTINPEPVSGAVVHPSCVRLLADQQMTEATLTTSKTMDLSRDGRLLLIYDKAKLAIHDFATGKLLAHHAQRAIRCAAFSPDGRGLWLVHDRGVTMLKMTSQDARLMIVPDRESLLPEPDRLMDTLAIPGGAGVFIRLGGGHTFEWRTESGEWWPRSEFDQGPVSGVTASMFSTSRDGRWIAGFPAGLPVVYESAKMSARHKLGSRARRGRASFSPDNSRMVFIDMKFQWDVYEAPDWHHVASSADSADATDNDNFGMSREAAWSPDGSWFAAVCGDGTDIQLVKVGTWRTMAVLHGPLEKSVASVIASPDGSSLIVQRNDLPVEIWNLRKLEDEMRALGIDLRLPPPVTPPPSPPDLAGPFKELVLSPLILQPKSGAKQ